MNDTTDTFMEALHRGIATKTSDETIQLAHNLAAFVPENQTLALHGDLGVGKTTFVQGLAQAWNITEPITSPTFNLYTVYQGSRQLVHLDAYRLDSGAELDTLMMDDFLVPPWCMAIEWPERIAEELPESAWHLYLSMDSYKRHRIRLKA